MESKKYINIIKNKILEFRTSEDYLLRLIKLYVNKLIYINHRNNNLFYYGISSIFVEQSANNIVDFLNINIANILELNGINLFDEISSLDLKSKNLTLKTLTPEQNLDFVNILIQIDDVIGSYLDKNRFFDEFIREEYEYWFQNFTNTHIENLLKTSTYYSYYFDENNKELIKTEEKYQLDNINIKALSQLIYLYNSSKDILSKECYFSHLAKKIYFIFNKHNPKYRDLIIIFFKETKISQLEQEINGYFRHSYKDPGQQKIPNLDYSFSEKWRKLSKEEKEKIMKENMPVYLFLLSILRNNNLIDEFEESFSLNLNEIN